jgi:hypothetical protein
VGAAFFLEIAALGGGALLAPIPTLVMLRD